MHCGKKLFSYKPKITKKKIDYSFVDSKIRGYLKEFKHGKGSPKKDRILPEEKPAKNKKSGIKKLRKTWKKISKKKEAILSKP